MTPRYITLPTVERDDGDITYAQNLPFPIARAYWIHTINADTERGSHAHKTLTQLIVPVFGAFIVHLHDGVNETMWPLCDPTQGLLVPPMHWRTIDNFDAPAVVLVLASAVFDETDYIRDWDIFLDAMGVPRDPTLLVDRFTRGEQLPERITFTAAE